MYSARQPGQTLAIVAESLYLLNLLLIPGLAFLGLLWLYGRHRHHAPLLARNHLQQALCASVAAGLLLIGGVGLVLLLGGTDSGGVWAAVVLYFTICHATLILLGIQGLVRALAGKMQRYPLLPAGRA